MSLGNLGGVRLRFSSGGVFGGAGAFHIGFGHRERLLHETQEEETKAK